MSSSIETQLQPLKNAILNSRPPYCAGTFPLSPEDLVLFYGKEESGSARRIDFNKVTDEDLQHLSSVCDRATFGLNNEDVLDESYRKAGKLDAAYFASKIDCEASGLMDIVRYDLLEGNAGRRPIKAELYKLNVYGKGSFFKAHKDTPRSTTMFGSLVLVLPTPHEGGALILRHSDKEWTFDSAKALLNVSGPNVGYVTFFSDVEHEVTLVQSGYRVTLTYNLSYDDEGPLQKNLELAKTLPLPGNESAVKIALGALLEDPTFLPEGGHLGFGLNHEYPIELKPKGMNSLDFITRSLKGSDALVKRACEAFKLDALLNVYYQDEEHDVLVPKAPECLDGAYVEGYVTMHLMSWQFGGKLIKFSTEDPDPDFDPEIDFPVHWATDATNFNKLSNTYLTFGNDAQLEHAYGRFCLIVKVGPTGSRATTVV